MTSRNQIGGVLDMMRVCQRAVACRKTDCIINDVPGFFGRTSANIKLHVNLL